MYFSRKEKFPGGRIFVFLIPSCFIFFSSFSQPSDTGKIEIIKDHKLDVLLEKWQQMTDAAEGKKEGFRIQIHFGVDKTKAKEIKADFQSKYPVVPAYEMYDQPNFKIRVGDFRTRLDAYRVLKQIAPDFEGSFIVEDKIELPKTE